MLLNKRVIVMLSLIVVVVIGVAASAPPQQGPPQQGPPQGKPHKRNLKVLPKNISKDDLDKVMDGFKKALGVKCNFCHAQSKTNARRLDFASDEKPEKKTARHMIQMAAKINKKFFNYRPGQGDALPPVTCMTCHNGKPHPEGGSKKDHEREEENH